MAMHVVEKNVRNAEANASNKLWKRLNPSSGNPKTRAPRAPFCEIAAGFVMGPAPIN
jgi:hypothetical protein